MELKESAKVVQYYVLDAHIFISKSSDPIIPKP